jgi:hypothetical protein
MIDVVALPGPAHGNGHGDSDTDGASNGDVGLGGTGALAARMAAAPIPAPPAPPAADDHPARVSKARPARLVYPSRDSDTDAERLFVAVVTVDSDGFVVGAHLTDTGTPGPLRDDAAGLIFKFRYAPALDDDGRPVRSTFEQPFQLAR